MNPPTLNDIICAIVQFRSTLNNTRPFTMNITTIGIDLAKLVFQVRAVNAHGKVVHDKQLKRNQMAEQFVNLKPCLIRMEADGSAHYWARKLESFGPTVKLMHPDAQDVCTEKSSHAKVFLALHFGSAEVLPRYELYNLSNKILSIVHD